MRRLGVLAGVVSLLLTACGGSDASATTSTEPSTTTTVPALSTTTTPSTTTAEPTTTTSQVVTGPWTVDRYGSSPVVSLGSSGALGSGCSPGTDHLPDGIWFGWITDAAAGSVEFDLACLWPGRLEPAAGNDSNRIRAIPVHDGAVAFLTTGKLSFSDWSGDRTSAVNAPGLPGTLPFWLFVNDGRVTELAEYPEPIVWARSATAWPGLVPGCCDGGDVGPPSPDNPLPAAGWPADGFYKAWNMIGGQYVQDWPQSATLHSYELQIARWLSCADNPGMCPEWWVDDEVTTLPDGPFLDRALEFDHVMTAVIMPIFGEYAIVGDGDAFGRLLADFNDEIDRWIQPGIELREHSGDPAFPFGEVPYPEEPNYGQMGYRGPGGAHLTWFGGWMALEIRDGRPILYIHAGLIAG